MIIVRTYELRVGDYFRMLGKIYRVVNIGGGLITYRHYDISRKCTSTDAYTFGVRSLAMIEIIPKNQISSL